MTWQCSHCETINSDGETKCEVCGTRRPSGSIRQYSRWILLASATAISLFVGYGWGRSDTQIIQIPMTVGAQSGGLQATIDAQSAEISLVQDTQQAQNSLASSLQSTIDAQVAEMSMLQATQQANGFSAGAETSTLFDFSTFLSHTKIEGPLSGDLPQDATSNIVAVSRAQSQLSNFISEVMFYNPYNVSKGRWDCGIGFRDTGSNLQYRLVVASDNTWNLWFSSGNNLSTTIAQGSLSNLNSDANGSNLLRLVVLENMGLFFLNDRYVARLDLSAKNESGGIWVGTGLFSGDQISGEVTRYDKFNIWSLP